MMRYVQHDFSNNVVMLQKAGQTAKAKSIVISELAQLIIYHRGHVIQALNEAGIKTSKYATDTELVSKLVDNLATNKKLQGSVSYWLVVLNTPSGQRTFNSDGQSGVLNNAMQSAGKGSNVTVGADPVSAIAGAVGSIFGFFGAKQDAKNQADQNKAQLAQALLQGKPNNSKTTTYVIVGAVVAVLGVVAYFYFRDKKSTVHHDPVTPAPLQLQSPAV